MASTFCSVPLRPDHTVQGARDVRAGPLREFTVEHHDAHSEFSVVREKVSALTWSSMLFGKKSASSHVIPMPSLPMRIAVVGNHLPRQCGIATFTNDLCDAIAAEYGAAGLSVVAVNDPQSGIQLSRAGTIRDSGRRPLLL